MSKETIMIYNATKDAFQKAALAGAKKCALIQYREASLIPLPPKFVTLPLSAKKYLQDKFNIPDNRTIIKGYENKKPMLTIGLRNVAPKRGGWSSEWFLNFR